MTDIKQLIERLRESDNDTEYVSPIGNERRPTLAWEAADCIERLTQPVGVEPADYKYRVVNAFGNEVVVPAEDLRGREVLEAIPRYDAETVARLQAEKAQLQAERDELVGLVKEALENPYREGTKSEQEYKESILRQLAKIEGRG